MLAAFAAPAMAAAVALGSVPAAESFVEIRADIGEGWLDLSLRQGEFEAALADAKRILG